MEDILAANSITKTFGGLLALDNVTINLRAGKIHGLIGPNGSGKTTLLNLITGVIKPTKGKMIFKGSDITGKKPHTIAGMGIGRTFQIPRVFPNLTTKENVQAVFKKSGNLSVDELLRIFSLDSERNVKASRLGYAQKKSLELARVMALNPEVILLDEPMSGLEVDTIHEMSKYIRELNETLNKTLLIVEHNLEELFSLSHHIFVLDHGVKLYEGEPEAIKDSEVVHAAYFGK
ncbi:MAG: ABC transporter ATP-binding protein [Nitrososphaerales archaeon]